MQICILIKHNTDLQTRNMLTRLNHLICAFRHTQLEFTEHRSAISYLEVLSSVARFLFVDWNSNCHSI